MNTETLPYAIKSPRVAEALVTLGQHIQYAIKLTRLQPIQTSDPVLSGDTLPLRPKVTQIDPDEIAYETRPEVANRGIKVIGENLGRVREVRLIQRGEVGPSTASALAAKISHSLLNGQPDGKSFTAQIAGLASLPPGSYKLQLRDDTGQTTLSPDAFTIHSPKASRDDGPAPSAEYGIQALLPPSGHADQQLCLWVMGEGPSFTNETCFEFEPEGELKAKLKALHSPYVAELEVAIPKKLSKKKYALTATTGGRTATAIFRVLPQRTAWFEHLGDCFTQTKGD